MVGTASLAHSANSLRHCERSEAIHVSASRAMDCFAALAMTMWSQWGDKITCRANQSKPVQPFAQKYSAFVLTQITGITPPVSRQMRGVGHRHERAVRCDGRRGRDRRTRRMRTAKSCGSDVAVLALRPGEAKLLWDNGGKRAVLREEHEVSRKAIAQGRPECSRCPVCSCAVLFAQIARETAGAASTRSSLRPLIGGREVDSKPRAVHAARSRPHIQLSSSAKADDPVFQRRQ